MQPPAAQGAWQGREPARPAADPNAVRQRQGVIKAPLAGDQAGRAMQDGCCCQEPAGKAPLGMRFIARL